MATWRVNNATALGGEVCAQWQTGHAYSLGARCVCRSSYGTAAARGYVFECTTPGTSHGSTEPSWPTTPGNTVADNDITWTCRKPDDEDWNNATCFLSYLSKQNLFAAGDSVYVHEAHSEIYPWDENWVLNPTDTYENPVKFFCVDKADNSLSEGAILKSHPTWNDLRISGGLFSVGIQWHNGSTYGQLRLGAGILAFIQNGVIPVLRAELNTIIMGADGYLSHVKVVGDIRIDTVGGYISATNAGRFIWRNGKIIAANGLTNLFQAPNGAYASVDYRLYDIDLSAIGSGAVATSLFKVSNVGFANMIIERCKLPSAAGFVIRDGNWQKIFQGAVRLHHCSSGNKYYDFHEDRPEGTVESETIVVRTGGASDGTTPQSHKMISSGSALDNLNSLESPPIVVWNSAATEKTFTIECLVDSATNLQNDEVWMELEYPADNSSGLGAVARDKCAFLGTPADKSAGVGDENWTTTELSNPNSFKCFVTVTPGKAGPVTARIYLAKASTTIYVDPKITVS
jgi:hypothetical protein